MTGHSGGETTRVVRVTAENHISALAETPLFFRLIGKSLMGLKNGSLLVETPAGERFEFAGDGDGTRANMTIHDWSLARRVVFGGSLGFAEGYIAGEWDSSDVTSVLELFCQNEHLTHDEFQKKRALRLALALLFSFHRNTKRRSKKNIAAHYDLGNEFYRHWLDETMTYSSAIFSGGENDLRSAQMEKYRSLARMIALERGNSVLEIGCGWGAFAEFAAKEFDCNVTALTISQAQYEFAKQRIYSAGLNDKVAVKFQDYRDETGQYDRIASIEMFEAVGEKFWPVFFDKVGANLKSGGIAGLQVITITERFFADYRNNMDFIQRYIFPGGMLPTPSHLYGLGERFGLTMKTERIFGHDYAATLAEWRRRFCRAWPEVKTLGFDERFRRTWNFYLHYCEAGFQSACLDVRQLAFQKDGS